jgi:hypothetical protein
MYLLDLALDAEEVALPTKRVPWGRYASTLKKLGLAAVDEAPEKLETVRG